MDLILDFETLGQSVMKCPILNCSFFLFDWKKFETNPYSYDEILNNTFHLKLDVSSQVKDRGYVIEQSSLGFWETVGAEAKKQLMPSKNDLTYDQFCDKLMAYLQNHKIDYWWSRSNTFDPILLWRIFEDAGRIDELNNKLKFWRVRDIRTYIDAKLDFGSSKNGFVPIDKSEWDKKFRAHDSRHDITGDVLRLQKIIRVERDLS